MIESQRCKKIGMLSLGCPRNLVDSELLLSRLSIKNYRLVDIQDAQVAIVNTCCFIKEAKEESIEAILDLLDLKKEGHIEKIVVYGCLVERYAGQLLSSFKEVDAFVGRLSLNHSSRSIYLTPGHYAYMKICEGCANACSFCVIPRIKGKFSSRSLESIIQEAKTLEERGVKEINIIGQDITLYGQDLSHSVDLTRLLKELLKATKDIRWIRLLYLYPSHITDDLLELVNDEPRICKYIDLPLQHINDRILKLMHRDTTRRDILDLINKIRKKISQVAIRTALMVGFPTETEKEFAELLKFVEDMNFERLGVFTYSREEGTVAFGIKPQVREKLKQQRFQAIMLKQQELSKKINERSLGRVTDVLIDECQNGTYIGRTQYDSPQVDGIVFINTNTALQIGQFLKVKVIDTLEYDLVGEVL